MNSDILNTYDESRTDFKPYGLTCELWTPCLMKKSDRHNEIELNYFTEGTITYLLQGRKVAIPPKKLTIFWGLIPHQIVQNEGSAPYFVCTIPFSQFLEWKLPVSFVDKILKGEILQDESEASSLYDEYLLNNWITDITKKNHQEVIILEMRARLSRMAINNLTINQREPQDINSNEISQVEKIAIYIAQNHKNPIKVSDIGKAVGFHPDYANALFKKTFGTTLSEYITGERIAYAQRELTTSCKSITEIAFECGFNSISRFNATFLKINNCTPREYKKRYHEPSLIQVV